MKKAGKYLIMEVGNIFIWKDEVKMTREEISRIFRNPPILDTARLYLRKMNKTDSADMYEYSCREDVTRYL